MAGDDDDRSLLGTAGAIITVLLVVGGAILVRVLGMLFEGRFLFR